MANPGESLKNSPWETRWTCPECLTDHYRRVITCDGCGTSLRCTIEREPVPVCTIADEPGTDA